MAEQQQAHPAADEPQFQCGASGDPLTTKGTIRVGHSEPVAVQVTIPINFAAKNMT